MKTKLFLLISLGLFLSACQSTNNSTNTQLSTTDMVKNRNIGVWIGEARYFANKCPNLSVNLETGVKNANQAGYTSALLEQDGIQGVREASRQFSSLPAATVCKTALWRYGPTGSRIQNLLIAN